MSRVLIVDDEPGILHALKRLLRAVPCTYGSTAYPLDVEIFDSSVAALDRASHAPFDLIMTDYRMPGIDGVELLRRVRAAQPDAARLILSGYADLNVLVTAINELEIYRFIAKPWNDYELVSAIGQALHNRDLLLENRRLADQTRVAKGQLSPEAIEAKRLEALEPGITKVNWSTDGSVLLDPEFQDLDDN